MSERITVVLLQNGEKRSTAEGALGPALRLLNHSQAVFQFDLRKRPVQLRPAAAGEACSWQELEAALESEKAKTKAKYMVGVLDQPIENNWFSRAVPGKNVCFITTWSWEYISDIPDAAFLAYEMVENLLELMIMRNLSEQAWFFEHVVHTNETRGCLSDMCTVKPQISLKIRTGDICPDCMTVLRQRLPGETIEAVESMLEAVRQVAIGRKSIPFSTEDAMHAQVDQDYPFPIAYCLRVMASEQTYTRKWLLLYDLYRLIIKYLTFCLLADREKNRNGGNDAVDLTGLGFAQDGQWARMAFVLAQECQRSPEGSFFKQFAHSFDDEHLEAARKASMAIVTTRNDQIQGHGFTPPEPVCQQFFERHLADLKTLLGFIKPLANFKLIKPDATVQQQAGNTGWRWKGKYMMGSNPAFAVQEQFTKEHPNNDCVLVKSNGDSLSLHPWLLLDYCPTCYREMVFLYDRLDRGEAIHREYPTNHNRQSRERGNDIMGRLGL